MSLKWSLMTFATSWTGSCWSSQTWSKRFVSTSRVIASRLSCRVARLRSSMKCGGRILLRAMTEAKQKNLSTSIRNSALNSALTPTHFKRQCKVPRVISPNNWMLSGPTTSKILHNDCLNDLTDWVIDLLGQPWAQVWRSTYACTTRRRRRGQVYVSTKRAICRSTSAA